MWHTLDTMDIVRKLKTNINYGLTEEEAKLRLEKYGKNTIENKKKENLLIKFLSQFSDVMIIILIVSSIISALITKVEGTGDYLDSIIIIAIVVLNAITGMVQELKAEKSIEALKNMSSPVVKVKRSGNVITIPTEDVVIGDLVFLESRKLCSS